MATRLTGVRFLDLGHEWRKIWITGRPLSQIALNVQQNPQTVSRAIWLAKIPEDIKQRIRAYPDVFTRVILLDTFAAKRRQCEKDGFALLRSEIERLISLGAGTKPKLKKTNKSRKDKRSPPAQNSFLRNPDTLYLDTALEAEFSIKKYIGYQAHVNFYKDEKGEIKISFKNKKELLDIVEMMRPRD